MLFMMTSAPLVQQRQAPTREAADSAIVRYVESRFLTTDANDMLYYFDAVPGLRSVSTPGACHGVGAGGELRR